MRAAVLMLALGLSACNSTTPTAPTPPPAPPVSPLPPPSSIISISVTGDQWISTTSAPVQMSARVYTSLNPAQFVDGTEHVTWSVDPAGFATIDRVGRVTPLTSGSFTVIATVGDKLGRHLVRVLPNYSGNWSGDFIISGCSGARDPRTCGRAMFGEGLARIRYQMVLALSQDRDQVTGTVREIYRSGELAVPVTGFVRLSGALILEGTLPQTDVDPIRLTNWSATANAAVTQLSGAYTKIAPSRAFNFVSTMRTEHEFANLSRAQ